MRSNPSRIAPIRLSLQQLTKLDLFCVTLNYRRALPALLAETAGGNCLQGLVCAVSSPPVADGPFGSPSSRVGWGVPRATCRLAQPKESKTKTTRPHHERLQE